MAELNLDLWNRKRKGSAFDQLPSGAWNRGNQTMPFEEWTSSYADMQGINPNPFDPNQFYDYLGAYDAGTPLPGPGGHLPSQFKLPGHPNQFVNGIDTITGLPQTDLGSPETTPTGLLSIAGQETGLPGAKPTIFGVPSANIWSHLSRGLGAMANAMDPERRPGQAALDIFEHDENRKIAQQRTNLEAKSIEEQSSFRKMASEVNQKKLDRLLEADKLEKEQLKIDQEKKGLMAQLAVMDPKSPEYGPMKEKLLSLMDYKEIKGSALDPFKEKVDKPLPNQSPEQLIATINDPNTPPEKKALAEKNLKGLRDYNIDITGKKAEVTARAMDPQARRIGEAIINGTQPPEIGGFGMSRVAPAIREYLADQGYDLTKATEDWQATKKLIQSMNSTQQVRLRQAVEFAYDSLDIVENLAKEWKAGNFPLLNKANLKLAANGAYGQEAAKIATKLEAQINDLSSELGTVYKGGNSSTDESLKLAASNLKAEWSEPVLLANIDQVRQNLQIRKNSLKSSRYVGSAVAKPYDEGPGPSQGGGVDQHSSLVSKYFGKEDTAMALKVMKGESGGDPGATNTNKNKTQDSGLFQINDSNIPELQKAGVIKDKESLKDPETNIKAAAYLKKNYGWKPWRASIFAAFKKANPKATDKEINDELNKKGY